VTSVITYIVLQSYLRSYYCTYILFRAVTIYIYISIIRLFQSEWNATDPAGPGPSRILCVIQYERDEVDNNNMFYTSVPRNNRESESHLNDSVVLCGDRNLFPSRPPPQPFCSTAMQEVYINKL